MVKWVPFEKYVILTLYFMHMYTKGTCAKCEVSMIKPVQGGHILADMKFPVFSLCFPCVAEIFPVFFY